MDTTTSLRYIVELGATGMCDGPPGAVGSAERLRKLEGSRAAWKSSAWSQPVGFPNPEKVYPYRLALSGNLVVFDGPGDGRSLQGYGGKFLLLRFPSEARGISEQLWYLDLDCERIETKALDDSQDLIIFSWLVANVESRSLTRLMGFSSLPHIHVRTLSSGCIHPLSSTFGLIDSGTNSTEYEKFSLCIHDDRLAFMASVPGRQSHVLVWDWKTGNQVANIASFFLSRSKAID